MQANQTTENAFKQATCTQQFLQLARTTSKNAKCTMHHAQVTTQQRNFQIKQVLDE
jgi:hypothetical protein